VRDTIDMAREAGLEQDGDNFFSPMHDEMDVHIADLKRFEALVRADERNRTWTQEHWTEYEQAIVAAEREACAKVCEDEATVLFQMSLKCDGDDGVMAAQGNAAEDLAAAIRARGNT
jgi:hypothetical protein